MTKSTYTLLDTYMCSCMDDSAHDRDHIYRVLYNALEIAETEPDVDYDVLIGACLLHDVGRKEQYEDPSLCHAAVGAEKAYAFLRAHGFGEGYAQHVKACIQTHRFRKENLPATIEAKILFDADKLDVTGAIGIARTLLYRGIVSEPLYTVTSDGTISDGTDTEEDSFFREYKFKLEKLYSNFYTKKGAELAADRQTIAADFYTHLLKEVRFSYEIGQNKLAEKLE